MTMADSPAPSRITTLAQLDAAFERSHDRPFWLFKHSLVCSISSDAWHRFERFAGELDDPGSVGVVEIQNAREISRAIAERTGVRHESPQALLIQDGRPVWHASHWDITEAELRSAARALQGTLEAAGGR